MAADEDKKSRHAIYLTDTIWGRLKDRAVIESRSAPTTASDIIEYLLESSIAELDQIAPYLSRYQPRKGENSVELRQTRTVYVKDEVWKPVSEISTRLKFSVSGLVEYLLIPYLGLGQDPRANEKAKEKQLPASNGQVTFLLGDNPFVIDPKSNLGKER